MVKIDEFITNREIATIIWVIAYAMCLIYKNRALLNSLHNVISAVVKAKYALLLLVIFPTIISIFILSLFITIDYDIYKTIVIWTLSTNLLVHSFSLNNVDDFKTLLSYYSKVILTIPMIWYVIDFISYSLIAEMIIIPLIFLINGMYNCDYIKLPENIKVRKIVTRLYILMYCFWGYSFYLAISSKDFCTKENLEQFISTPTATFVYMALTYPLILILKYQELFYCINTIMFNSIQSNYRNKIFSFCKFNINKLSFLKKQIFLSEQHNSATLSRAIDDAIEEYK